MDDFEYFTPQSLEEAIAIKARYGDEARYIAGGTNLLYMMKRKVRRPQVLIGLESIRDLDFIRYDEETGLAIGALAKISQLEHSTSVNEKFPILAQAASKIATPQIRNMATVAGNLCQENWCWYLMEGFKCWMNEGRHCFAPMGDNRYHHSVMGGYFCVAIHPSDLATVLMALGAQIKVATPVGEKVLSCDELLPGFTMVDGKLQQNILKPEELIIEIEIPPIAAGTRGIYLKFANRLAIDFALSSVAVLMKIEDEHCKDLRIVFGGVATKPCRAMEAEEALIGKTLDEENIRTTVEAAFEKTVVLSGNAYRINLTKALLRRALVQLAFPYVVDEARDSALI